MIFGYIRLFACCLCYVSLAYAAEITAITFSGLSYAPLTSFLYPHQGWTATFDFSIDASAHVSKGDYFTLSLPSVYRIKFDDNSATLIASLNDGTQAFECYASQQAAYLYEDTIFQCDALVDLSSYSSVSGSISFAVSFNSGGSIYEYELQNANTFHSGTTEIPLGDQMSASITFDASKFSEGIYAIGRTTTFNSLESYYLGMECPNGYLLGGFQTINYDKNNQNLNLNCSSAQIYLSNSFNDWSLPINYQDASADVTCSANTLNITMKEADSNQLLWVNALQYVADGVNTVEHDVLMKYSCSDTSAGTTYATELSTVVEYTIYQGSAFATLSASSVSQTSQTLAPTSRTETIHTYQVTSTSTTSWTGTFTTTYSTEFTTISGTDSNCTEEVIYYVEIPTTPCTTSTEYTSWTGTFTSTFSTESTFITGKDSRTTSEIIYHVETPTPSSSSALIQSSTTSCTSTSSNSTSSLCSACLSTEEISSCSNTTTFSEFSTPSSTSTSLSSQLSSTSCSSAAVSSELSSTSCSSSAVSSQLSNSSCSSSAVSSQLSNSSSSSAAASSQSSSTSCSSSAVSSELSSTSCSSSAVSSELSSTSCSSSAVSSQLSNSSSSSAAASSQSSSTSCSPSAVSNQSSSTSCSSTAVSSELLSTSSSLTVDTSSEEVSVTYSMDTSSFLQQSVNCTSSAQQITSTEQATIPPTTGTSISSGPSSFSSSLAATSFSSTVSPIGTPSDLTSSGSDSLSNTPITTSLTTLSSIHSTSTATSSLCFSSDSSSTTSASSSSTLLTSLSLQYTPTASVVITQENIISSTSSVADTAIITSSTTTPAVSFTYSLKPLSLEPNSLASQTSRSIFEGSAFFLQTGNPIKVLISMICIVLL